VKKHVGGKKNESQEVSAFRSFSAEIMSRREGKKW
jgi:hypothetical protein